MKEPDLVRGESAHPLIVGGSGNLVIGWVPMVVMAWSFYFEVSETTLGRKK